MLTAALALAVAHSHVAVRGLDDDSCWATTLLSATSIAGAVALPPPDPLVPMIQRDGGPVPRCVLRSGVLRRLEPGLAEAAGLAVQPFRQPRRS